MIDAIKNLYREENLPGSFLTQPLKSYHNFFVKKIENCCGLKKVAWLITHLVTGVFAYPILGILAGLGLVINLTGIHDVKENNNKLKFRTATIKNSIIGCGIYATSGGDRVDRSGYEMKILKKFVITKINVDSEIAAIDQAIDDFSAQYKKIYMCFFGSIAESQGEINVALASLNLIS